ncbi:MAG: type II toxin-antitoxin system VapC family toxin [Blastocatellia bacterium]
MIIVLDTDHLTVIQRQPEPAYSRLRARLQRLAAAEVFTTMISVEEQMRGWLNLIAHAKTPQREIAAYQRLHGMLTFFASIPLLDYTEEAAVLFNQLRHSRVRIGSMDLKIAAISMAYDALLLSGNLKDYLLVPNLKVEDWTG